VTTDFQTLCKVTKHSFKKQKHQECISLKEECTNQAGTLLPTNTTFKSLCICLKYRQNPRLVEEEAKANFSSLFEIDFKFNVKSFKMKKKMDILYFLPPLQL